MAELVPVLVTTKYRGVFFGWVEGGLDAIESVAIVDGGCRVTDERIRLSRMRNVLYWSRECKGVFGLASSGPRIGCKIGPACGLTQIPGVSSTTILSPDVAKLFEEFQVWI